MDWVRAGRAVALGALVLGSTGCGEDQVAPIPTGQSLFAPQFSGNWSGTAVLTGVTSVADGECVQPTLQAQVGTAAGNDAVTLAVSQEAQNLAARLSSSSTGLACSYTGTTASNSLALNATSCDTPRLIVRCANGSVRDLELLGSTVQGAITAGQLNGTMANSYNVYVTGSDDGVTRVTLNYQFSAVKP